MKLYALKGIRDTYKVIRPMAVVKKASSRVTLSPAVEVKVAETLAQFIETPTVYPDGTAPEIVEGYRVLRREALKALAQSRAPISGQKVKQHLFLLNLPMVQILNRSLGWMKEPKLLLVCLIFVFKILMQVNTTLKQHCTSSVHSLLIISSDLIHAMTLILKNCFLGSSMLQELLMPLMSLIKK